MTKKLTIYVGCSLSDAPDEFKARVFALKDKLRQDYTVLDFKGQIDGTNADVYTWDIERCVADCDVFVAVCDYTSIGLGWELNEAIRLNKHVIGTAHSSVVISRLVLGAADLKPNFTFHRYEDLLSEVPKLIENQIAH